MLQREQFATRLEDVLFRRSRWWLEVKFFGAEHESKLMAEELDWSEERRIAELGAVQATLAAETRILEEAFA